MHAFGADRVRAGKGEQQVLFSPRSKGWQPRIPKTLTTSEHPGTAILWEDQFFEVVTAGPGASGGVRYVLEPWRDHHIIRVSEPYDAPSEERREAAHRAAAVREKGRKIANLAGIFTGLLPAVAQEQLGSELGLLPAKLTALSLLVPFAYLIWFFLSWSHRIIDHSAMPWPLILLAAYLFLESVTRLNIVWFQRRPAGSAAGFIIYLLFYLAGGKRTGAVSPFEVPRGRRTFVTEPPEDVALLDAYSMREPLLTLLSPAEQNALAQRFGYDYREQGFIVAWVILGASATGVASALVSLQYGLRSGAVLSLLLALALGAEQIFRLSSLRRGPTASMLAVVVRPLTRKLLR